ncbi:eight transmembrane protein EpsH [Stanieria cyanosphaera PCC 7437]|uniref:Eight transmembrane protein EpsH n=1 Tax=Stanieria cyanosphaera (strain ATCC 29371 / PCC 7437) TaxID=111780 RepID=K9XXI7_STAC7|nr:cyanoexosortase B [Stanieria cyanosphaera]AFZ36816.1 eight transmembrane protein EpsH [Stanieria cyanosphaera PCC 7437]
MQINYKLSFTLEKNFIYLIILALLSLIYAPVLFHWYDGWLNKSIGIEHEYFSHGIIGIPFAFYIVWNQRKKWQRLPNQSHPLGFILLIIGSIFYLTGVAEFVNLSLPIILTGLCLWLKGIAGFKLNSFALLLIALATPTSFPYLITPFTLPLQKFIAGFAGFILIQLGMDVTVEQIYLAVGGRLVEVAPYCAGLKMLFTSLYVGLMLLYWTGNIENRKKTTLLLVGAALISVSANIIRNTILTFFHGTGRDQLFTWFHDSWGGDLYSALMLASVVLLLNFLDQIESLKSQ